MLDVYTLKHFDFQELSNGLLSVTFRPMFNRNLKTSHYCLFERGSIYYDVAMKCKKGSTYWLEINWLAEFVKNHDKQIIPSI